MKACYLFAAFLAVAFASNAFAADCPCGKDCKCTPQCLCATLVAHRPCDNQNPILQVGVSADCPDGKCVSRPSSVSPQSSYKATAASYQNAPAPVCAPRVVAKSVVRVHRPHYVGRVFSHFRPRCLR